MMGWMAPLRHLSAKLLFGTNPPAQKLPIAAICIADKASLAVSREKDGNCGSFTPDGTMRRSSSRARSRSFGPARGGSYPPKDPPEN